MSELNPVLQALLATLFTWGLTAAGAAVVFMFRDVGASALNSTLGFAAGVMIAASYWSLLAPAIELGAKGPLPAWVPPAAGFMAGGAFLWVCDRLLPHLHPGMRPDQQEGLPSSWRRSVLLVLAVTLHNIPEGLAVGVAFGAAAGGLSDAGFGAAMALAMGIGLQNVPEGMAVAVPLKREGMSRLKSFWYGQLSGAVEPVAGVLGAAAVMAVQPVLPYALAFAAGAMIYVVIEELVPESQLSRDAHFATMGAMLGFVTMMILDVALG